MSEPTRTAHLPFLGLTDKVVRLGHLEPPATAPRTPLVRIHLLGSMRATTWLGQDILPRSKKARAQLVCLCVNADLAVTRYRISGLLWDRVPESQANTSFRQALRQLTAAMQPLADELIILSHDTIRLDASACWVDVRSVLTPQPPPTRGSRGDLAAPYPGELLDGLDGISASFDQWLMTERTRFNEQLRELLESELRDAAAANAERRAAVARRVIGFDPTHERASRALMRALADMGERAQALHEYERCRDALRTVLDVEPSSETRALHEALRAFNEPAVAAIRTAAAPPRLDRLRAPATARARSRLRVKVLPFQAHAAHAERLAFRLSQDIADGLARFRWFDVIAPTVFECRQEASSVSDRDELHYAVDGSLAGDELRMQLSGSCVSVRLLDVADGYKPLIAALGHLGRGEEAASYIAKLLRLEPGFTVANFGRVYPFHNPADRERYMRGLALAGVPGG